MASNFSKFFEYMKLIGHLKQVERTGWVRNSVKNPESVAEHMYRMAMMAFALPSNSGLDRDKCIKIALVHDMAESVVGDLTPWCGVSKDEKSKREKDATHHMSSLVSEEAGQEMYQLWLEYEDQTSPEAKFVKDLDKFEMLFQAYEYENQLSKPKSLQEFFDHTLGKYTFSTELVNDWTKELVCQRDDSEPTLKGTPDGKSERSSLPSPPLLKKRILEQKSEEALQ
ncbi:unnamed protein product [Lymnaea stagnalis]|uniref:5'-deoxynucleotidase HDDC2 n=1 Tax=Lymnaea stagnalis TaxID=6523 RepID=A0AAV2HT07_LYMST